MENSHEVAQGAQAGDECKRPPEGWKCSRAADHQGPCAASKADPLSTEMSALELMQTWTGEDWSEMAERFPALAEQIEGARRAALATQPAAYVLTKDGEIYWESDDGIVISNTPGDCLDESYEWRPVGFITQPKVTKS